MSENILLSELTATLKRVQLIATNISDPLTKQIAKDAIQYLTPMIDDIKTALGDDGKQKK